MPCASVEGKETLELKEDIHVSEKEPGGIRKKKS